MRLFPWVNSFFLWLSTASGSENFDFAAVEGMARSLAAKPYEEPAEQPKILTGLNYIQYRAIKTGADAAIWGDCDSTFQIEVMHPGYLKRPVRLNLVSKDKDQVAAIPFERDSFDYSAPVLDGPVPFEELGGFAGFRIRDPLDGDQEHFDEIGSFVGARNFRLPGRDQVDGMSVLGLDINSVRSEPAEEFPDFVELWLFDPEAGDDSLFAHVLLDRFSVTGAYQFENQTGGASRLSRESHVAFGSSRGNGMLDAGDGNRHPLELRCVPKNPEAGEMISETWIYRWTP